MKIGIDIDDTTFFTVKSMLKYGNIFEEEISGKIGEKCWGKDKCRLLVTVLKNTLIHALNESLWYLLAFYIPVINLQISLFY